MAFRRSDDDVERPTPSPPSWYVYVLIASLAGGGGGLVGSFADPAKVDPLARPDPYTGTMAKSDLAARDYRLQQLEKHLEKMEGMCELTQSRVGDLGNQVWLLNETCKRNHGAP